MSTLAASSPAPASALPSAILGAATAILLGEGVAGLSMRKIAQKIGYSPTALYLHFPHKDAILHALLDDGLALLHASLDAALEAAPADPEARLRAVCGAYLRFGQEHPARYEVVFLLHPRHMERYPPEKYRAGRRSLDRIEQVVVDAGCAEAEAPVLASAVWAQLHGAVALLLARRFDVRLDAGAILAAVVEAVVASVHHAAGRPAHA